MRIGFPGRLIFIQFIPVFVAAVAVVGVVGARLAIGVLCGGARVVELVEVLLDVGVAVAVVAPHCKRGEEGEKL